MSLNLGGVGGRPEITRMQAGSSCRLEKMKATAWSDSDDSLHASSSSGSDGDYNNYELLDYRINWS